MALSTSIVSDYAAGRLDTDTAKLVALVETIDPKIAIAVADARRLQQRVHLRLIKKDYGVYLPRD